MTLKDDPKKNQFLRNIHFLYDAIHLKQSMDGTFRVQGKSLITVLDEVHFIVNLYSLLLRLVPHANPSFTKISYLSPFRAEQLPKLCPLFFNTSFLRISQLRLESTKW